MHCLLIFLHHQGMSVLVMLAHHIYILTVGENNIGVPLADPIQRREAYKNTGAVLTLLVCLILSIQLLHGEKKNPHL